MPDQQTVQRQQQIQRHIEDHVTRGKAIREGRDEEAGERAQERLPGFDSLTSVKAGKSRDEPDPAGWDR